jgi:hypothetical protein
VAQETKLSNLIAKIIAGGRAIGPYAALELLMPGGSLLALLLWIYRNHQNPARAMKPAVHGPAGAT